MVIGKRRVMIIGLDSAVPTLVEGWLANGKLPAMAALASSGVTGRLLAPFPTITASNWASIATGAWPGTHGITDYFVHHPGEALDKIGKMIGIGYPAGAEIDRLARELESLKAQLHTLEPSPA